MSKSSLTFLAFVVLAQLSAAADIEVLDWVVPYNGETEYEATVGDTITFRWDTGHNVYIHPSGSCDMTDRILVGIEDGASYVFTEEDAAAGKPMFFACDIGDGAHCRFGQKLSVTLPGAAAADPETAADPEPVADPEPAADSEPMASESMASESSDDSAGSGTMISVASLVGLMSAGLALVLA